jgi:hypothetical protein
MQNMGPSARISRCPFGLAQSSLSVKSFDAFRTLPAGQDAKLLAIWESWLEASP